MPENPARAIEAELEKLGDMYFSYNLPIQMWPADDGGWSVLNYMPRKESVKYLEEPVAPEQLPDYCKRAAKVLRNLADLFDALGERRIDVIYYPDEDVAEAIADCERDRAEAAKEPHEPK